MLRKGIYFLANDRLYDLVVAFLNSLREHNPDIGLCLIPYNGEVFRISRLSSSYNFVTLDDKSLLSPCDDISVNFHGKVCGHYRKLVAWNGIFDQFVYIDIDTIVLRSVSSIFSLLNDYDVITAYSNDACSRKFVWKDSIALSSELTAEEISYSANTGFIISKRGLFDFNRINSLAAQAKKLATHMELLCYEQPLLNYFIVKSTNRYTSIRCLNKQFPARKLPEECWPGDNAWRINLNGTSSYNGEPKDILHVHWSGIMAPQMLEKHIYSFLNRFGLKTPSVRLNLKQGHVWRHYRYLKNCECI